MKRSNWGEWVAPDLESLASVDASTLPFVGYTRRSHVPDGLTVVLAAESGRPLLYPIFPINGFAPNSECAHKGPIREGSSAYCPTCHDTGLRKHKALRLDPATMPAPEQDPPESMIATDPREPDSPLTRKQRRALHFKVTHVGPTADAVAG